MSVSGNTTGWKWKCDREEKTFRNKYNTTKQTAESGFKLQTQQQILTTAEMGERKKKKKGKNICKLMISFKLYQWTAIKLPNGNILNNEELTEMNI